MNWERVGDWVFWVTMGSAFCFVVYAIVQIATKVTWFA